MTPNSVCVAADHAGVALKAAVLDELQKMGISVSDLGSSSGESVDYPDFALKVTDTLTAGQASVGILICGTGIGMSIAANKMAGIRAALCRTEFEARMSRAHNDANVLCLGQRVTGVGLAIEIVRAFVLTSFEGGRHASRVAKLNQLDERR
jgi:ribose 5-phosphate isomerase B